MEEDRIRKVEYVWHVPYRVVLGDAYAKFLNGLKQKKILGNICPKCKGLHVPAKPYCELCFVAPTEWVETDGNATLISYAVTYVKFLGLPDPPHITGIVKVGDSITNFLHFVAGVPFEEPSDLEKKLKIGMKLRPVWKEERVGDMFDIAYFEPA